MNTMKIMNIMNNSLSASLASIVLAGSVVCAAHAVQSGETPAPTAPQTGATSADGAAKPTFDAAAQDIQAKLDATMAELSAFRESTAAQKIPLNRSIGELEQSLVKARQKYQATTNLLATRSLDLTKLNGEIKSREEEIAYLSGLLGEYLRNFESGLHIVELQRYRKDLDATKLVSEDETKSAKQRFEAEAKLLATSIERLHDAFGGTKIEGSAVDAEGKVLPGTFVLAGPVAIFRSADGAKGRRNAPAPPLQTHTQQRNKRSRSKAAFMFLIECCGCV